MGIPDHLTCLLRNLYMGSLQSRILEWIAMPSSRGSSQSGIELRSPALQVDSLPAATREALTYVYPTLNIIRESLMKCISIW